MKSLSVKGFSESAEPKQSEQTLKPFAKFKPCSTSIKAMLRSQKRDKKGVYVRVTIDKKQDYFATGYYVLEKDFDGASGLVKGDDPQKEEINSYIRFLVQELDEVLSALKKSGELLSIENFQRFYERKFKKDLSFESFFKIALAEKKDSLEPTSVEVYSRLLTKMNEFAPGISVRAINKGFVKQWELWLTCTKGLCQNTANHYFETLRTFLIKAEEDEIISINPFNKIKIKQVLGERDYLAQEELDALINLRLPETNSGEIRAREMFVFCCLTGIRYSDLMNLKWTDIRTLTNDMYFKMHKTKFFVSIPLIDQAKEILSSQKRDSEFVFKKLSNQTFNYLLHQLEKKAGIQKKITVHVARHTFATLALEKGVPLEVVSKILGHKNLKTTMIYAKITQKTLHTEMKKLNGMLGTINSEKKLDQEFTA